MEWIQALAPAGLVIWLSILILPWRPWSTRESLDSNTRDPGDLSDITVLIPARNEAGLIPRTLAALAGQGPGLKIIVVDDQSTDGTREVIEALALKNVSIIAGEPALPGWSGKLWALEQARRMADTDILLLLDADIELKPEMIATLRHKLAQDDLDLLSLMASLRMQSFWERLLIPAFIYFFKLLYPFSLSNRGHRLVAAAAGGCIMLKKTSLQGIGGFAAIRDALIDDCSLAMAFRRRGYRTWIGLTHDAVSLRAYDSLAGIWHMVTRTAFTQLRYSWLLLLLCIAIMTLACIVPIVNLVGADGVYRWITAATLLAMLAGYFPVVHYYRLGWHWTAGLPLAGIMYLLMTCHSALLHQIGAGTSWKGRTYHKTPASPEATNAEQ